MDIKHKKVEDEFRSDLEQAAKAQALLD